MECIKYILNERPRANFLSFNYVTKSAVFTIQWAFHMTKSINRIFTKYNLMFGQS